MHQLTSADARKGQKITTAIVNARKMKLTATAQDAWDLMDAVGREGVTVRSVVATLGLSDLLINHKVAAPESAAELESVAKALKIAHTIMRLEHNESTSNSAYREAASAEDVAALADKVARLQADGPVSSADAPDAKA